VVAPEASCQTIKVLDRSYYLRQIVRACGAVVIEGAFGVEIRAPILCRSPTLAYIRQFLIVDTASTPKDFRLLATRQIVLTPYKIIKIEQ
jgi:hypothetical protein